MNKVRTPYCILLVLGWLLLVIGAISVTPPDVSIAADQCPLSCGNSGDQTLTVENTSVSAELIRVKGDRNTGSLYAVASSTLLLTDFVTGATATVKGNSTIGAIHVTDAATGPVHFNATLAAGATATITFTAVTGSILIDNVGSATMGISFNDAVTYKTLNAGDALSLRCGKTTIRVKSDTGTTYEGLYITR